MPSDCDVCRLWQMPHPQGCQRPEPIILIPDRSFDLADTACWLAIWKIDFCSGCDADSDSIRADHMAGVSAPVAGWNRVVHSGPNAEALLDAAYSAQFTFLDSSL